MEDEYNFKAITHMDRKKVEKFVKDCQNDNHVQQVAYSTYHNALTQTCFDCFMIRTDMNF